MLAVALETELNFPVYATPKLDGIRALKVNDKLVSRTFKEIKNKSIQEALSDLPNGVDGELISGNFQESTHRIMSADETSGDWRYYLFDYVSDNLNKPYLKRCKELHELISNNSFKAQDNLIVLMPREIKTIEELHSFEEECLASGFEGVIIRSGNSPYKCGRSTAKEGYMLKLKKFLDAEAEVIDFVELENNENEVQKDNFGRTKRSDKKEGKTLANTLGKLILKLPSGETFGCGTGFTAEQRKTIWDNKSNYLNKMVKFKYFPIGTKDLPRHPVFLGFRHNDDMETA